MGHKAIRYILLDLAGMKNPRLHKASRGSQAGKSANLCVPVDALDGVKQLNRISHWTLE